MYVQPFEEKPFSLPQNYAGNVFRKETETPPAEKTGEDGTREPEEAAPAFSLSSLLPSFLRGNGFQPDTLLPLLLILLLAGEEKRDDGLILCLAILLLIP